LGSSSGNGVARPRRRDIRATGASRGKGLFDWLPRIVPVARAPTHRQPGRLKTSREIAALGATVGAVVIFTQFVDDALGCASYLVGDESSGDAIVVDPAYAIEQYLEEAERRDVRIVRVVETHTHADHLSGHGRLAREHGIPISIHPDAGVEYAHDAFRDGDELSLGEVVLRCVHTPGHRPEHCCVAVLDTSRAPEPWIVLTGDSLFVGDTARPDLVVQAQEGAEALFASLQRLVELGDGIEVYPGHVAGSLCGKAMSSKASTTIGFERRFNPGLASGDVAAFVAEAASVSSPRPPNMERIVELNRGPFVGAATMPPEVPMPPEGAQVLDVRPLEDFAQGHLAGAVSVPVDGSRFSTKAAFVLDPDRPVVVAASDEAQAERALRGLRSVAVLDVPGYVLGGGSQTLELVSVDDLEGLLAEGAELIDVRERDERDSGYIAGSRNIPYRLLPLATSELPDDQPLVTICDSGPRAAIAASILTARGHDARAVVAGGVPDWQAAGKPTVEFRRCGS
jgi:hydroxyacylglutathione hydrolase